ILPRSRSTLFPYTTLFRSKGIKLLLVGEGEKRKDFEQLVKDLKLTHKVIFTGFKANPYPYLKSAEFMVLASKNEGFPNVILESLDRKSTRLNSSHVKISYA